MILQFTILLGLFSTSDVHQIVQEVVKMKDFKHPHIMPLIGVCLDTSLGMVMPFMANGSVLNYLKKEKDALLLSDEADIAEVGPSLLCTGPQGPCCTRNRA